MITEKLTSLEEAQSIAKRAIVPDQGYRTDMQAAIDYLYGGQLRDVVSQLQMRYPATQQGESGQRIEAVAMTLVERYVDEAANAYNKPVTRTLVDEAGQESEATKEQTDKLKHMLGDALYDETMFLNEQLTVLLLSSCVNYEAKRGKLRAAVKVPQNVFPCPPAKPEFLDPADPDDYDAFLIELHGGSGLDAQKGKATEKFYALQTAAELQFWTGQSPTELKTQLSAYENPYEWEQSIDVRDPAAGTSTLQKKMLPGRMLTFWHYRMPLGNLIPPTSPEIVAVNREINVAWSSLLDVIKMQGHAVPVLNLQNKTDVKGKRRYGTRFPLILKINESFQMAAAATSFSEQVSVLKDIARMVAVFKRLSPNDFSFDGSAPISGFAKLIDQLPKLEAREQRIRRLIHQEENEAWPRLRAIGIHLGLLDKSVEQMKMRAKFAEVDYPRTEDERAKKYETDTKYNQTTDAKIYADRFGVSLKEAEEAVAANAEENQGHAQAAMQPQFGGGGFGAPAQKPGSNLGSLIGRTNRQQPPREGGGRE